MIERLLAWPERRPGRIIAAIGLLFALTYGASLVVLAKPSGRVVIGDAVHYYVYLRSAVFDGDLHFENEYVRIYQLRGGEFGTEWVYEPTATGHTRNLMSIGPALAWAPLYLVVTAVSWLLHAIGLGAAGDGYGRLFEGSAGVSGALAATIGAYLAYRAAAQLLGARAAIWATLIMWLGSSAIYYSLISPTYSHAISMLTVGIFVLTWLTTRDRQTIGRYALVGFLGGLASLVRWQDAVLLIIPAIDALWYALTPYPYPNPLPFQGRGDSATPSPRLRGEGRHPNAPNPRVGGPGWGEGSRLTRALTNLAACGAFAVLAFLPQMMVWNTLYGSPFLVPQGEEFMKWTDPALIKRAVRRARADLVDADRRRRARRPRRCSGSATRWSRRRLARRCSCRGTRTRRWPTGGPARRTARGGSSVAFRSSRSAWPPRYSRSRRASASVSVSLSHRTASAPRLRRSPRSPSSSSR